MNKNEESERNGFVWPVILQNPNAHANIDYYYGPYGSLDDLKEGVPNDLWVPGFTAAVQDEAGEVTEWWVQGEGADARWEQKGVKNDTYLTLKGVKRTLQELESVADPSTGDMYLVQDGEKGGGFLEYVYIGGKWELLGRNSSKTTGAVYVTFEGKTTRYDGTSDMSINLDIFAKMGYLDFYTPTSTLEEKYAKKTDLAGLAPKPEQGDVVVTMPSSKTALIARDGVKTKFLGINYSEASNQSDMLLGYPQRIKLSRAGAFFQHSNGWTRINPLVLAVRITDKTYTSDNSDFDVQMLYNPYNLPKSGVLNRAPGTKDKGYYKLTHYLKSSTVIKSKETYTAIGNTFQGLRDDPSKGWYRSSAGLNVSVTYYEEDWLYFNTQDDESQNRFYVCELYIYDFSTY